MIDRLRKTVIKWLLWGRRPVYPVEINKWKSLFIFLTPDGHRYISNGSGGAGAVYFVMVWDEDLNAFALEPRS